MEIKWAGSCVGLWPSARTSRPVPLAGPTPGEGPAFQHRTNTSWRSTRSQPAVSRRLFRCLGAHLLRSPSIVKSGLVVSALVSATNGHTPPVERDRSSSPNSVLRSVTSFRCRLFSTHSFDPFVSLIYSPIKKQKTLLTRGKQGLEILWTSITCLPPVYPMWVLDSHTPWIG